MQSTFTGIEIGKRSLIAHNQAISTTGHNLSNASVEGYSRQRVEMNPTDPIYMPQLNREETPGQIGQGVDVARIERIKDMILEGRIVSQANGLGYWDVRDKYILMAEQVYNEPSELSVRGLMDKFWESWQELSLNPSELASRKAVIQRGKTLIDGIHSRYESFKEIRDMLELEVQARIDEINAATAEITQLNEQIVKVKAMGDSPNDLLDKRDKLVEKLSTYINITTDTRDPDEFTIHSGGIHIVQGKIRKKLGMEIDPLNEGYTKVIWEETGENAYFRGGMLASLFELRDGDIRAEIQNLDTMTINFIDMVNGLHRRGWGLNGKRGGDFFTEYPFVNNIAGNYDRNGDGAFDSSYIFRLSGSNKLSLKDQLGLRGTLVLSGSVENISIDYYPTDTVEDIISRINTSGAEVAAQLDSEGRLQLKGTPAFQKENPDFVIRHAEDTGQFLVGYAGLLQESGGAGAYDWEGENAVLALEGGDTAYAVAPLSHPSGWIEINPAVISDVRNIAAGFGENGKAANPGDGSTALAIASLRNSNLMIGKYQSFDEYFSKTIADIGLRGEEAEQALETEELIMKELKDMRDSISGVNMDEELAQMIKFQHGYSAAARFVNTINTMLDTIINRMGV